MTENEIIEQVAKKYNITPAQMEDLKDFMWLLVRRCIVDERGPGIRLAKFGTWFINPTRISTYLKYITDTGNHERSEEELERMYKTQNRLILEKFVYDGRLEVPLPLQEKVARMTEIYNKHKNLDKRKKNTSKHSILDEYHNKYGIE